MSRSQVATTCLLAIVLLTTACANHHATVSSPARVSNSEFIDLQPGWRLRVLTPLGKTADFRLRYREVAAQGNTLTLETDEFQGYETAHYAVESRGAELRIRFTDAEVFRNGASMHQPQSIVPLFRIPPHTRFLRLVYLTRVSSTDHNMAVIACRNPDELAALTRAAQANDSVCGKDARCSWIPAGIAVRPERKAQHLMEWSPVR